MVKGVGADMLCESAKWSVDWVKCGDPFKIDLLNFQQCKARWMLSLATLAGK